MVKEKKVPQRMCIVCKQMRDKKDLIRIVKNKDGEIKLDKTLKMNGRGAYICNCKECISKCFSSKMLNKAFSMNISDDVYMTLREEYDK